MKTVKTKLIATFRGAKVIHCASGYQHLRVVLTLNIPKYQSLSVDIWSDGRTSITNMLAPLEEVNLHLASVLNEFHWQYRENGCLAFPFVVEVELDKVKQE